MNKFTVSKFKALGLVITLLLGFMSVVVPQKANAAAAQEVWLRLDRVKASTATGGLVCMKTNASNSATEDNVLVTFPSDFTINETEANWTVGTSNLPSGATAWPSIAAPNGASDADNTAKTVRFGSGALAADTLYCFTFSATNTLTNPSAGNSKTGNIAARNGTTVVDEGNYAVSIISEDQITVTASVPSIFTLALSGNAIAHGTLTAGTVDTGSVTATIGTNASAGWVSWIKAGAAQLTSASSGGAITSPGSVDNSVSTLSGSTYGWVLDVIPTQDSDGDGTISQASNYGAEYDGGDTCAASTTGGTLSTNFEPVAASNGTSDNEQLELCSLVRVAAFQEAATDYTQTLTFTAAGRF